MDLIRFMNQSSGASVNTDEIQSTSYQAPVELMSQFLIHVGNEEYVEALKLTYEILQYEPKNKMIKEYQDYLIQLQELKGLIFDDLTKSVYLTLINLETEEIASEEKKADTDDDEENNTDSNSDDSDTDEEEDDEEEDENE